MRLLLPYSSVYAIWLEFFLGSVRNNLLFLAKFSHLSKSIYNYFLSCEKIWFLLGKYNNDFYFNVLVFRNDDTTNQKAKQCQTKMLS